MADAKAETEGEPGPETQSMAERMDERGGDPPVPDPEPDPDADPGTDTDDEPAGQDESEQAPLQPFYNVGTTAGGRVTVRAGYIDTDGEIANLAINATVGFAQAQAAQNLAYNWYVAQVRATVQATAQSDDGENGDD